MGIYTGGGISPRCKLPVAQGPNGIILNEEKFVFRAEEVDWARVKITKDKVDPLDAHVEAIRKFPTPTCLTDMRSYWALVNQVAYAYACSPHFSSGS